MENQKSNNPLQEYQANLNSLILAPIRAKVDEFLKNNDAQLKQALFWCDNSFLGRVERDLILSKKKILEELLHYYDKLKVSVI